MFSLSNLKNAAFVTKRFSFALRSLAHVSCRLFPLALPLSRAATDCLFSLVLALAFSQSLPFLVRTALVRLRYRCYLCCCCHCRCFLVAVSNGGTGRQACEAGRADIQAVVRLRWHWCVLFCFLPLPSPFSCFLLLSCFLWALPLLLGLLVLWIQCVLCFLLYLFGILFNWT